MSCVSKISESYNITYNLKFLHNFISMLKLLKWECLTWSILNFVIKNDSLIDKNELTNDYLFKQFT